MTSTKLITTLVIFVAALSLPMMVNSDTTYVNVDIVPTGIVKGNAQATGESDHSGAFIFVSGTSIVGTTDASGDYVIIGVPYGTYSVSFSRDGYITENSDCRNLVRLANLPQESKTCKIERVASPISVYTNKPKNAKTKRTGRK